MKSLLVVLASLGCVIFSFSGVRVLSVQTFDIVCFVTIAVYAIASPAGMAIILSRSQDILLFALLMLVAIVVSGIYAKDLGDHLDRSLRITVQIVLVWLFVRTALEGIGLTSERMISLALLSCSICCASIILQGGFGLFTVANRPEWVRLTGLAEHPIEAGYIAAFGVLIAIDALARGQKPLHHLVVAAICAYSFRYSVSLSAVVGLGAGVLLLLLFHRRFGLLLAATAIVYIWLQYEASSGSLLFTRLSNAINAGGDYDTLASRVAQGELTISLINEATLLFGRGFARVTLPYGLEVHNTLLASVYHFGLFGLAATLILWRKLIVGSFQWHNKRYRALMIGLMMVFVVISLTGPSLARRSLWFPLAIVALAQLRRPETASSGEKMSHLTVDISTTSRATAAPRPRTVITEII